MQMMKIVLGVCTFACVGLAGSMVLSQTSVAQTLYVPGSQSGGNQDKQGGQDEPKLYVVPQNGDFSSSIPGYYGSGSGASSNSRIYNAPDAPRSRSRQADRQDMTMRSARLKEIDDLNIQKAHRESLENSKRVQEAQKGWKASREAYSKQYFENKAAEAAKQEIALQNGVNITGGGGTASEQATDGSGQPTLYLQKKSNGDLEKPARIFNIFD